jgi:hypothetical protein
MLNNSAMVELFKATKRLGTQGTRTGYKPRGGGGRGKGGKGGRDGGDKANNGGRGTGAAATP